MPTIRAWTAAQYRGGAGAGVPVSDYLFHALKKIHMMSEFKLVPLEPMNAYLGQLKPIVMSICPAEDREILAQNLSRLGETTTTSASVSPVQQIHRQMETSTASAAASRRSASAEPAAASSSSGTGGEAAVSGDALRGLKRVSLLLERLEAAGGLAAAGGQAAAGGTERRPWGVRARAPAPVPCLFRRRCPRRWPSPRGARSPRRSSLRRSRASTRWAWRREPTVSSARSPCRCPDGSRPRRARARPARPTKPERSARCGASSRMRRIRSRRPGASTRWSRRESSGSTRDRCPRPCRCSSSPRSSCPRRRWTPAAPRSPGGSWARRSTRRSSRSSESRPRTRTSCAMCWSSSRPTSRRACSKRCRARRSATAAA